MPRQRLQYFDFLPATNTWTINTMKPFHPLPPLHTYKNSILLYIVLFEFKCNFMLSFVFSTFSCYLVLKASKFQGAFTLHQFAKNIVFIQVRTDFFSIIDNLVNTLIYAKTYWTADPCPLKVTMDICVLIEILLVIIFGVVKLFRFDNFCFDSSIAFLEEKFVICNFGFFGFLFLLSRVVINSRSILGALVDPLSVQLGRVVIFPKYLGDKENKLIYERVM